MIAVVALVGCNGSAPAGAATSETVATVNGQLITTDDVAQQLASSNHQVVSPDQKAVLEAVIDQELAAQKAAQQNLELDPAAQKEIAQLEAKIAQLKRKGLAQAWYDKQSGARDVTEADARAWYDAHRSELGREVKVTMVLKRSLAEIEQVRIAAQDGVALTSLGGRDDLGWLGWAQLQPQWRAPLLSMKPGDVSPVLVGDHGRFWLLQLLEVREAAEPSFETALPQLKRLITTERLMQSHEAEHKALREGAKVTYAAPVSSSR